MIILKWSSSCGMWTGFMWLSMEPTILRSNELGNETSGSIKDMECLGPPVRCCLLNEDYYSVDNWYSFTLFWNNIYMNTS
jgi:hypothetical protein